MAKKSKYIIQEIKEFEVKPQYSGNVFFELDEFIDEQNKVDKQIIEYINSKVGKDHITIDFPKRSGQIKLPSGQLINAFVEQASYTKDFSKRILLLREDIFGVVRIVFQIKQD